MAYCSNCGTPNGENAKYCNGCGAPLQAAPQQIVPAPATQPAPAVQTVTATTVMILGIVGLALAVPGTLVFPMAVAGLIVSCIALNRANVYREENGGISGRANVGFKLATAGRIVGIVSVILSAVLGTLYFCYAFLSYFIIAIVNVMEYFF